MAKKFGKFMLMSSIAAAAGAGVYHYLKGKKAPVPEDNFDADDFEDFDDDLDEDLDETPAKSHPHMSVSIDIDAAKGKIGEKVIETLDKAKEFIGEVTSTSTEPVYTKVDLPSHDEAASASVSSTYESDTTDKAQSQNFYNDTGAENK